MKTIREYQIPAIGWFLKKGPRFYRDMIDGKEEGLKLPQLERGTMIHEYILQPEDFGMII